MIKNILLVVSLLLCSISPIGADTNLIKLSANPVVGTAPLSVQFVAYCGTCVAFTWDFGDGSGPALHEGPRQMHTYYATGTYAVYYVTVAAVTAKGKSYYGTNAILVYPETK